MLRPSDEQVETLRLALTLAGLSCNSAGAELVLITHHAMGVLGKDFSVRDVTDIQYHIDQKYHRGKLTTIPTRKRDRNITRKYIISTGARKR